MKLDYEQIGRAAAILGMQIAADILQEALDNNKAELRALQNATRASETTAAPMPPEKRIGRPPGSKNRLPSGWPADPEERSREMKRRMAKARRKKAGAANITPTVRFAMENPATKLSEQRKDAWARMPKWKRQARLDAMLAGRRKKARQMEAA